jgi:CRP-like cAMP-binding protein
VDDLQLLAREFPALEHQLLAMSADRMDAAENHIVLLSRKTAAEKVAAFLLASQEWQKKSNGDEFDLPMSRSDIADYLGLTIETVSRVMTKLASSGLISIRDARHISVKDPMELKALARPEGIDLDDY